MHLLSWNVSVAGRPIRKDILETALTVQIITRAPLFM